MCVPWTARIPMPPCYVALENKDALPDWHLDDLVQPANNCYNKFCAVKLLIKIAFPTFTAQRYNKYLIYANIFTKKIHFWVIFGFLGQKNQESVPVFDTLPFLTTAYPAISSKRTAIPSPMGTPGSLGLLGPTRRTDEDGLYVVSCSDV